MRHHFGRVDYLQLVVILIVFVSALIVDLNTSSDTLVTDWDEFGQPVDYAQKELVLYMFPVMILVFYLMFLLVPYISHHENLEDFYVNYGGFRLAVVLFLSIVYYSSVLQSFSISFNMNYVIIPAFSALFFYFGHMIEYAKPNHYIGFKNKWTQKSEDVWEKTHKFSGFLFKSLAFISLLSLLFPQLFLLFFLIPLIVILFVILFYSKFLHDRKFASPIIISGNSVQNVKENKGDENAKGINMDKKAAISSVSSFTLHTDLGMKETGSKKPRQKSNTRKKSTLKKSLKKGSSSKKSSTKKSGISKKRVSKKSAVSGNYSKSVKRK